MLKAGIFLDVENLNRCGGYGMRFRAVRELVEAQGAVVLRANAYMAIDRDREEADEEYRKKRAGYRDRFRREGFHLILKEVQRYQDPDTGSTITKANADLDLAVDALLQADNLDYILLGSGDGDFLRLVRALQNRGKRVDLLSFDNTSSALRQEVDHHFDGFLFPDVLPLDKSDPGRLRGFMHAVNVEKGYGFLTVQTGLAITDIRDDIFLHIKQYRDRNGYPVTNEEFERLKVRRATIEFELVERNGNQQAVNAIEFSSENTRPS